MVKSLNVVILEKDPIYQKVFTDILNIMGSVFVYVTSDPLDALGKVSEKRPDLFLIDMVIVESNCLGYLKSVREVSPKTKIVIDSQFIETYAGADFEDISLGKNKTQQSGTNLLTDEYDLSVENEKISDILHDFCLPDHIKGSHYIEKAIKTMVSLHVPPEDIHITKEIYPTVAKECFTKYSNVERGIRYCIGYIIEGHSIDSILPDPDEVNENGNYKLSNSKFLTSLTRYVLDKLSAYDK